MAKGKYSKRRDVTDGTGDNGDEDVVDLTAADAADTTDAPRTTVAARPSMTRLYKADPKGGTKSRSRGRVTPSAKAATSKPLSKEDRKAARIEARNAARSAPRPVKDTHAADGARLAPIPSRGFAAIIDIVVVGLLYLGLTQLLEAIYGAPKKGQTNGTEVILLIGATFLIVLIYAVPSVALTGQTLGHRILKLRVRRTDAPGPPGYAVALRRYVLIAALPNLPTLGSLLAMFAGLSFYVFKDGRSVLDRIAKTEVIAYGPERAGSSLWRRSAGRA